jgi:hypothetical protein
MKKIVLVACASCISSMSIFADPTVGQAYRISFVDVDGNSISIGDGYIITVVLATRSGIDKARTVGDRTPDFCLGNPTYRMITVLVFEKKHTKPARMILNSLMRRRLDSEGRQLQGRYDKLKITRDARRDVSAVADFDGAIAKQLGLEPGAALFHVYVFGKNAELLKDWSDVPSAEELAAALKIGGTGSVPSH